MKRVVRYETNDGKLHKSERDARAHLEELFKQEIERLARNAVNAHIEQNLASYARALDLQEELGTVLSDLSKEEGF